MKGKRNFLSTKTIIISILTVVLLGAAVTGTVLFLKDSGKAEAMSEQNTVGTLPVAGANDEQLESPSEPTIEQPTNEEGNDIETPSTTTPVPQEPTTTQTTVTGGTIASVVSTNNEEPEPSTVQQERVVSEETTLGWNNIGLNSELPATSLFINYQNLNYKVEYYFDGVIEDTKTETITGNAKGKTIDSYVDKIETGYKLDKVENLPLTVLEDENKNIIKVYYIKDESQTKELSYTVEYYKDNVKVEADTETVKETVWVNNPDTLEVTTTVNKDKYVGYKLEGTDPQAIPEKITNGETIKIYYVKDESQTKDLKYTVEYYKDNVKVEADTEIVKETVWVNDPDTLEVTTTVNKDKYVGYKLEGTDPETIPQKITTGETIKVYYVKDESQTKELSYTVEYYKDNVKVEADTETVENTVWVNDPDTLEVTTTVNKDKYVGYKLKGTDPETIPQKITTGETIKVYYVKDESQTKDLKYTVEYYKDNVKVEADTEIVKETVWVNDPDTLEVTTTLNKDKYVGYKLEGTDPEAIPEKITNGETIKVYYVKDESQTKDLKYTVEYYKDNVKVEADTEIVKETVWVNDPDTLEVTTTLNKDKYVGYKLEGTDPETIPEEITNGETIKIYYVKDESQTKDLKYTVEYYKDNVKVEADTEIVKETVWVNDPDTLEVTTTVNKDKYIGYKLEGTDPEAIPEKITNGEFIKVYYIAREDINYTINYYKEGIEKPFKTENMQGTFGTTVTVPDEKISENKPDGFAYDRTNPIKLLLQIDENKNILNVYYKASMQPYTVNYYLENTTVKLADSKISSARTETKIVEEAIEIEGYSKKAPITEEIIITTGNNEINFYYTPRTDISYTVNYYLENTTTKLAESKIVNGKTFNTTVQEEAKDLSYNGYEAIKTTESLLLNKVSGNEINFYYKERTDLSYTVKYYYNGVEDKTKEYTVENQTFGATINEYIDKNEDGWELESATAPITIGVGANVIKVYYTKPIIEVTKSSSKTGIVEPGDEITYTITATNTGKREGKVTITDKIPTGTELKGKITATGLGNVTKEQLESGIELTVPVQGGKVTVTFTVEVIGNAGTEISNQATVAGGTTGTTNTVTNKVEKTVGVKEQSETIKGTNVVLVVDTSGSMEGKKLQNAKNEAKKLIDKVIPTDGSDNGGSTISVIEFKSVTEWVVIIPVDKDYAENLGTAKTINQASELKNKVDGLRASGNTPMATALTKAESVLNTFNNNNDNVVIFLSDGDPTDSGYNTVATRIKNSGTKIYTIGFNTSSSADSILASIASKGCNYKAGIDDLANIFEVISSEISGEPVNTTSANGKIELSSKIYVDSKHPIIIKVNGTVNTTITSLPTDAEGKLTFENGKYYLDLTKFNPKDKVTIEYFSN